MAVWSYAGRRTVVTGCSSGMGAAVVEELLRLGAEVVGLDLRPPSQPVHRFVEIDLGRRESVDAAAARLDGPVDALFNCAGVSDGANVSRQQVVLINFVGVRQLTEQLIPKIATGGAIANVASLAALDYRDNWAIARELVDTPHWESAAAWCDAHADYLVVGRSYAFSKECVVVYTASRAAELAGRGIRINAVAPDPTATKFLQDTASLPGAQAFLDAFPHVLGRPGTPREQALPLVFLNGEGASRITGQTLWTDGGYTAAVQAGDIEPRMGRAAAERRAAGVGAGADFRPTDPR